MEKDHGKYFGSALMIGFGVVALYRWHQTQLTFFLLLVLRDFVAGYFFLKRKPTYAKGAIGPSILAYISSAIPLIYLSPTSTLRSLYLASDLMAILGFLFVAFATIELGTSIGISPANRGHVRSGIYRYIKHPMYLGYVISEAGLALINPINAAILCVSAVLYFVRAKIENKVLNS